jgi:ABC-type glycerol-3-phosphate transport system substrate-binding protein
MRRSAAAAALLAGALVIAASAFASGVHRSSPTKLSVWAYWSPGTHELTSFNKLVAEYQKNHPEVKISVVGGVDDNKIVAAIRSGTAPDVVSSGNSYNVANYCRTGGWVDLAPLMKKDNISVDLFPKASQYYTQYAGKRCALPLLADDYGLYYNKALFKKAGITHPPRTISELTADAKKLTVRNANGTLKVVGLDPLIGWYENVPERWITQFGGKFVDAKGHAILSKDPGWTAWAKWMKGLIDWYGYNNLVRFQTGAGDEFSASQAFENGKVAMNLDGEWRVAFIQHEKPTLQYGTAPMAVADNHPELYGSGYINGTIIGIPRGGKHQDEAWNFVKYVTTNTHFLAQFSNLIRNVPTTKASLTSPEIKPDVHFSTFLKIFGNSHSSTSPIMASGNAFTNLVQSFFTKWQAGNVKDLSSALKSLDKQLDAQVAQAGGGGGGVP